MTNKKSTKRALLSSVLSLVLCLTMLIGTTFAWFTDSVTSGNNTIRSGNLDVELEYRLADGTWKTVQDADNIFDKNALWEPGYAQVVYLRISNKGTLDLKYQFSLNVISETVAKNVAGEEFKLSQYLEYGVVDGADKFASREAAIAAVQANKAPLANYILPGQLMDGTSKEFSMVVYMPTTVGNEANYRGEVVPTIDLGLNLVATQLASELDSFDHTYDENATYIPAWDGSVGTVPEEKDGVITIKTAPELAAFAQSVNGNTMARATTGTSYSGKTVVLGADIDLNNKAGAPIGACDSPTYFQGTFDGKGHTIYNLNVDKSTDTYQFSTAGLFGWIDAASATIKNVNIENASVKGSHWVGALVGYMTGTVQNCTVSNSSVVGVHVNEEADGDKIGGLVGCLNAKSTLKDNSVSDCIISGNRDIGGLAGSIATDGVATRNKVTNVTITYITEKTYASAGEIVSGRTGFVPDSSNTAANVSILNGEMVAEGVVETTTKKYQLVSKDGLLNAEAVATSVGTGEGRGVTFDLVTNIDLKGETWNPIDNMWVTFNGNGHTISNMTTQSVRKSGLFGYAGAVTINDLTLENVVSTGSQAGTFAGSGEGLKVNNSFLKGNNVVNFTTTEETWNGIGAITGVLQNSTINVEIVEGSTVALNYGAMTTDPGCVYIDALTGYITANKGTVTNNGAISINKTVANNADLEKTLKTNAKNIVVTLPADSSINVSDAYIKLGGADTESIVINGNEKILTLSTTYWSRLDVVNPDAKIVINNATVTSSQASGTWNSYDVTFMCNAEFNNVDFEKAVALDGENKTYVMNNVSIKETHDYYALWISAAGSDVTINGLTIDSLGRGIKIDEQYVDAPAKVTLKVSNATFKTASKAAIIVKTVAGADITLSNIDISAVSADTKNAVWVDEDAATYFDKVTVTGGTKVQE